MSRSPFIHRASEQHHPLSFTPEGIAAQIEILRRTVGMGMNRAYMAQCWPDGMIRLVDYSETLPFFSSPELTESVAANRRGFAEICAEARHLGIEPWPSLNILNYPNSVAEAFPDIVATPPRAADRWMRKANGRALSKNPQLCASSVGFAKLVEAQVTEICQLPDIAGLECWLTAGDTDLFYCNCETCRTRTIAEMIAHFAAQAWPICQRFGKGLLLRTYLGGWRCGLETEVWREAAPLLPPGVEIAFKQQAGDFMTWHGPNPLAGELAPHTEHVEFDSAGEYRGINYGIVCTVRHQLTELIRHFADRGVAGLIFRKPYHLHAFDLDKWLFGELAQNPDLNAAAWAEQWARTRFGNAGAEVLNLLDLSAEILRGIMYVNGVQWASWAVPHNLVRMRFILFDRCAPCVPGSWERLQPTEENLRSIRADQAQAILQADELVRRCEKLNGILAPEFHAPLLASCQYLRLYARFATPLVDAFFHLLKWEKTSSEVTREYVRADLTELLAVAEAAIQTAREQLTTIDLFALGTLVEHPTEATHFAEPLHYAETILNDIRERIDVPPASWWSVYPWPDRWPTSLRSRDELYG